jgi:hypothetical protein
MSAIVEVPAALNVILREALIDGIGDVAEDLNDHIIPLRDRVRRPDRFDGPFDRLERIRTLLADLGWGDSDPADAVRIDLNEHGRALSDALDRALAVADDDLEEADDVDRERRERGEPPVRTQKERRARELRKLRSSVTRPASAEPTQVRSRRRSLRFRCCGVQVSVSSRVSLRQRLC